MRAWTPALAPLGSDDSSQVLASTSQNSSQYSPIWFGGWGGKLGHHAIENWRCHWELGDEELGFGLRLVEARLSNIYSSKGEKLITQYIKGIRDLRKCLPDFVTLRGAWNSRGGTSAPHSFTFCRRESRNLIPTWGDR